MKHYSYKTLSRDQISALLRRPAADADQVQSGVNAILGEVSTQGDDALRRLTQQFDGVVVTTLRVSKEQIARASEELEPGTKLAITEAMESIKRYHELQKPEKTVVETRPGVSCRLEWRPIQHVGLYIPGGSAPLISTVLMLGIPARIAGCGEVILCTPPSKDGSVASPILHAAHALGIEKVYNVGGAQAIAAMAVGTTSIPRVDKIFGPGNRYVTAMKSAVSRPPYNVAIDMLAGPTELLIIADGTARPDWIAADLLSQAEHGADSQAVLVTTSEALAGKVQRELEIQEAKLPRHAIAHDALTKSFVLVVDDIDEAMGFSNRYAPEHLMLAVDNPEGAASKVMNAGSVFLGPFSSVVFGDYASGTNHTLPTGGHASSTGGVTVGSFMKPVFFQTINSAGLASLATTVTTLARAEGLEAHARAVEIRKEIP